MIVIEGQVIDNIRYSDDTILMAGSEKTLHNTSLAWWKKEKRKKE